MDKICSQEKLAEYYNGLSKSKPVMKVGIFPTLLDKSVGTSSFRRRRTA